MFEISHNNENLKQICLKMNKNYPLHTRKSYIFSFRGNIV